MCEQYLVQHFGFVAKSNRSSCTRTGSSRCRGLGYQSPVSGPCCSLHFNFTSLVTVHCLCSLSSLIKLSVSIVAFVTAGTLTTASTSTAVAATALLHQ